MFQPVEIPTPSYSQELIDQQLQVLNIIISNHNEHGASLDNVKKEARRMLRLADVVNFAATIDYDGEMLKIEELNQTASDSKSEFLKCIGKISELTKEIETLRASQNDELKGAESVNALLNHFFGHDGIKLKAQTVEGEATVKFQILRDGHSAYHLSEGECSLIAFCYFIAKLEEPESKGKNLIIYIDDPISSLDGNHIFFLFSLIESLIAKPIADTQSTKNYKQLFISTHNLDFLKYIKRLSGSQDKHVGQFLVSRGNSNSKLEPMPDYLKNYITEFNYLFHQIFKCSNPENVNEHHEAFYSFGNNLRKFLEAYLFYKYPSHQAGMKRLAKFLGEDDIALAIINRCSNELSHLEEIFDRSVSPIDNAEIATLANYLLDKLYYVDKEQFNALMNSIGEPERADAVAA